MAEARKVEIKRDIQSPRRPRRSTWMAMVLVALAFVIVGVGLTFFVGGDEKVAERPAVLTSPAVAPGVAPPPPETTQGNRPGTTGQSSQ
jgi:hypothetical protein